MVVFVLNCTCIMNVTISFNLASLSALLNSTIHSKVSTGINSSEDICVKIDLNVYKGYVRNFP